MVRPVRVPTLVRDDAVTPEFRVLPERVPAAAVTVMSAEPLKATPLMFREVARVVAVDALPVRAPTKVVEVTEERPAIVVAEPPIVIAVLPTVTVSVIVATVDGVPVPLPKVSLFDVYHKAPAVVVDPCVLFNTGLISRLLFKSMLVKNFLDIFYSPSMTGTHILYTLLTV
jgi:hypothetical protein